ncbi:hairy and enhancer of split-related protein HELT-like [Oncorhynchus nerka]|uniref:hairy and enhancer of split-related protein HELT-like n=1 Tax=Oncorhynchus nerka TaxID=8023 RepID=UPI0031B8242F
MIKDALRTADTQDFDAILPFTVAQVHCSESSPPENYCWAGNLLLHEPALQGQDCPETDPAESGTLEGKSHTPPVPAIRHNKRQKSRDSAPAKNGTDDHINLELGDSGAPSIPNETPKRPVFNDMSDVDDQLFCDAANLIDPVNSTASIPAAEQERFFTLFSRALKSRNVLFLLGELLGEFANYFHYGYHECMKNLVHYLTTEERVETKDIKYARILAFLQSKSRVATEPVFGSLGAFPDQADYLCQLHSSPESLQSHSPNDSVFQQSPPGHFSWHSTARSPTISYPTVPLSAPTQQHHGGYLSPVQGLDHHYFNFFNGHPHANAFSLHSTTCTATCVVNRIRLPFCVVFIYMCS